MIARTNSVVGCLVLLLPLASLSAADASPSAAEVLAGLRNFMKNAARPDGSFLPGVDPGYKGISDSGYSDLAPTAYAVILHKTFGWKLPHEAKTIEWLQSRQRDDGAFYHVKGTADANSPQARLYNTTQGVVALRALGQKPRRDSLPVLAESLKGDYKKFPLYTTSFYPLAFQAAGGSLPKDADRKLRSLMVPADDGYLDDHVAATFHMVHYFRLFNAPTPKADAILKRVVRDQKEDGSWLLNPPSRDRHATFDAVFVLKQLGSNRPDCQRAITRAAKWALTCRNPDGGFGHFPGSTSDLDACYFQIGALVMAGFLKPVDPPPRDPHLLAWGHLFPTPKASD